MSLQQLTSIKDVRQFLEGTEAATFSVLASKQERYWWIQKALVTHGYMLLSKAGKGLITRYLIQVTGYSLAQTKRLIRQYTNTGEVKLRLARGNGFQRTYTKVDIRLLARMDGGSEFRDHFEQACKSLEIALFVLPPRKPKWNGCVERANGTTRYDFYPCYEGVLTIAAINQKLKEYQHFYNHYRPRDSIDLETPMDYYQQLMQAACICLRGAELGHKH